MRYALQILFYVVAWRSVLLRAAETSPFDPQSLKLISKDVESVLSPTLVDELKGAQSNRTAVNVDQTVARNLDTPGSITDKKPELHFDNQIYPFHYERSYHYEYPPPAKKSLLHPTGITERFYSPYFRPKNHVDTRDSRYYKADPSSESAAKNEGADESARASSSNGDSPTIREVERLENPETDRRRTYDYGPGRFFYDPEPLPPNGFAHRDIVRPSSSAGAFPAVDFDRFRESVIARSTPSRNGYYFGPNGDAVTYRNEPYAPRDDGKILDPRQSQPLETFDNPAAPPNSYQNYPNGGFPVQPQRSQYYPPGFLGSFFHPDDSAAFYDNYRPSPSFGNRFGENFTSNFPPRPAFGGFYPRNYVPVPSQPNPLASPVPASPETAQAEYIRPRAINEPIPAAKPNEPISESAPAASNTNYQVRLFIPGKNDDFEIERFESFSF